jgi:hypothetical protein
VKRENTCMATGTTRIAVEIATSQDRNAPYQAVSFRHPPRRPEIVAAMRPSIGERSPGIAPRPYGSGAYLMALICSRILSASISLA